MVTLGQVAVPSLPDLGRAISGIRGLAGGAVGCDAAFEVDDLGSDRSVGRGYAGNEHRDPLGQEDSIRNGDHRSTESHHIGD
jgi:hypothetical protein